MPTYEFTAPDGKSYEVGAPEGATQAQAFDMLQQQIASGTAPAAKEPSATVSAGRFLNDVPRQLGLTARYALEGTANTAQVVTEPLRYLTDKFLPDRQKNLGDLVTGAPAPPKSRPLGVEASLLADRLGLPTPQTPLERTVAEGTKLGFGALGMAGGAGAAADALGNAAPATVNVLRGLAANPGAQVSSAVGAGTAGQASKEAGGGAGTQFGASLLGGIAGGLAPGAVQKTVDAARSTVAPLLSRMTPEQMDVQIERLVTAGGQDYSLLTDSTRRSLRAELASALQAGKELNPEAVGRLAAFREAGATPTRGMISQDPVQITREQNLAKMAANSAADELHGLPRLQNQNNAALIGRLNDLGAGAGTQPIQAGRLVADNITGTRDALRSVEQGAWNLAKGTEGYRAPISSEPVSAAMQALADEARTGFLPKQITDYMQAFTTGQQPFTPQHYQNLRSLLSAEMASGGNTAAAARTAANALERAGAPIPSHLTSGGLPVTGGTAAAMRGADSLGGTAVDAVDRARRATAAAYDFEDSNALVRSVLADARSADPERIAQSFITSGTVNDARQVAQAAGPQGRETIKQALMTHIKRAALSGAEDETGKVSQSALKKALDNIGDEKLALFFSPQELAQLRSTSRVASLMQSQPVGSAVNNSNSGALLLGRGLDLMNKTPIIGPMFGPAAQNIGVSIGSRQAQNLAPSLLRPTVSAPAGSSFLLPGAALGGLLAAPGQQ